MTPPPAPRPRPQPPTPAPLPPRPIQRPPTQRPPDFRPPNGGFDRNQQNRRDQEARNRQGEIDRERQARNRDDLDRIRQDQRNRSITEREREINDRMQRRDRDHDRWDRDRRDIDHRRDWSRYDNDDRHRQWQRPREGGPRWGDRDRDDFWEWRYRRWYEECHRPLPPYWPGADDVIYPVVPYPNDGNYYDQYNVLDMATNVENLAFQIYQVAQVELQDQTDWNLETLSELYDVTTAAQNYLSAVNASSNVFVDTIDQLFSLEDLVNKAGARILCAPVSSKLRDNFSQLKYYVQELLWQYRLDTSYSRRSISSATLSSSMDSATNAGSNMSTGTSSDISGATPDMSAASAFDQPSDMSAAADLANADILSCDASSFQYSRPYQEVTFDITAASNNQTVAADTLSIGALSTRGLRGTNGIGGIVALIVTYSDGTQDDMIQVAASLGDQHFRKGQLVLNNDQDRIDLPVNTQKSVESIYVMADSFIAQTVPVNLTFALSVALAQPAASIVTP